MDEKHPLFRKFKGKAEMRTMEVVLRALHIADVPRDTYRRIIEALLSLK